MKKIIITGSLLSIFLLSLTATAQTTLEDCLARNKDPEHGATACYSQFIKQAQQKSKLKFQDELQKNTSDLQEATKKANEEQQKQLEKNNGSTQSTSPASPSTRVPSTTKSLQQPTKTTTTPPSQQQQQLKIEEEEETRSIPYY